MAKKPFNTTGSKDPNSAAPPPGLADFVNQLMTERATNPPDYEDDEDEAEPPPYVEPTPEEEAAYQAEWSKLLDELAESGGDLTETELEEDIRQVRKELAEKRARKDKKS